MLADHDAADALRRGDVPVQRPLDDDPIDSSGGAGGGEEGGAAEALAEGRETDRAGDLEAEATGIAADADGVHAAGGDGPANDVVAGLHGAEQVGDGEDNAAELAGGDRQDVARHADFGVVDHA